MRFVQADAIRKQLIGGHIVLLGNLAYSAAGEVLNCDCYSVATQAAIDLQADKLFCMTTPSLQPFDLPHWLPISDAEQLLQNLLESKTRMHMHPFSSQVQATFPWLWQATLAGIRTDRMSGTCKVACQGVAKTMSQ